MKKTLLVMAAIAVVPVLASTASSAPPRFSRPVDLPGAARATEPSLVIDPQGRIFVSAIFGVPGNVTAPGTPVWRSTDGGRSFTRHSTASAGPAATVLSGGDSALALDKRGYVYATDLWIGDDSISISTDHADTWVGGPVSHRMVGDRNWLAYSRGDDALYQFWNGMDGLWVARADLGGPLGEKAALTFANSYRVAGELVGVPGTYVRADSDPPGGIAVDQREGAVWVTWADQQGLAFAYSTDKGATWHLGHVPGTSVSGNVGDDLWNFAPVAVDSRGHVFVAWAGLDGGTPSAPNGISVRVAESSDSGKTWHVRKVSGGHRTAVFPTLAVIGQDRVAVAWVESGYVGDPNAGKDFADATWNLQYSEVSGLAAGRPRTTSVTAVPDVHEGTLFVGPQGGDRGMGDFFSMAVSPKGLLVIAYTRGREQADQAQVVTLQTH